MKIKLIFYYLSTTRYSINSLAGALETRDDLLEQIQVYFAYNEADLFKYIEQPIGDFKKTVVCFSLTTKNYPEIKHLITKIKSSSPNINILVGGPHITGKPYDLLDLGADFGIVSEAEEIFLKFLEVLVCERDFKTLESLIFKEKEVLKVNKRASTYVNLDMYPPITQYFNHYGPIEITRGCPFSCGYCQTSQIFGRKLRHRSVEKICEYVEVMAKRGLYDTRFITPSLFLYGSKDGKELNLEKIENLFSSVKKIIKGKGKLFLGTFPSELRPEHVTKETVELLKKYADNDNVIVGVQSGSERILELTHRRHTVEDVYKAVFLLNKAGFKANLDFIFGLPYETKEDVGKSIKVIEELTTKYNCRIHAHVFTPLPGTKFQNFPKGTNELYSECIKKLVKKSLIYGNYNN